MRFIHSFNVINSQNRDSHNQINRMIPDFEKKSSVESIKLIVNSNDYLVNKLVVKFTQLLYENT